MRHGDLHRLPRAGGPKQNGFEKALAEVESLEKSLGLEELARFTVR